MFAFVRVEPLANTAAIHRAGKHAGGVERSARERRRDDCDGPRCLALIKGTDTWEKARLLPAPGDNAPGKLPLHADYRAAYRRHLKAHGASKQGNANAALHLLVGVSPEYFDRPDGSHSGHDPNGRKVRHLLAAATDWADKEVGGAFAARYDLDERGYAVVDVLCAPIHTDGRSGKPVVSSNKAQAALRAKYPLASKATGAMQSSWADHATRVLGTPFDRGVPKAVTGREHVVAEEYGDALDEGRERIAELEAEIAERESRITALEERNKSLHEDVLALMKRAERMRKRMAGVVAGAAALRKRLVAWALSRYRAASRPDLPADPEHDELADETVGLAGALAAAVDPDTSSADHHGRVRKELRRKRRKGGWDKPHPEAPLHSAWDAEITGLADADAPAYEDWRHDLAHSSARGVTADRRDLIRLARRVERAAGTYVTRAERRRRQQEGESDGGIER